MPIRRLVPALIVVSLLVLAAPALGASSGVVISSLRLRTAASPYDEYVEIRNTSSATVDLSGWKLEDCYTSGGTSRVGTETTVPAQTRLPAGRTFVFGKDRGDYTGAADLTYAFQVKEDGGFRLDDATGALQDAAGAPGTGCHEGTGLTFPATGSDVTFTRTRDTDDNATDFAGPAGAANGTACGPDCAPPPVVTPIDALQGSGDATPFAGRTVTVTGVVVGVDSQQGVSNYVNLDPRQAGVYLETPTALQDSDPATSEGVFVGGLAAGARTPDHVGETMTVTGTATELYGLTTVDTTGHAPSFTGTGDPAKLPAPVLMDPARAAAQTVSARGTRSYYEELEGMRVSLEVGTADSGGTNKFGELFLRPGRTRARVFRDPAHPAGPPGAHRDVPGRGLRRRGPHEPVRESPVVHPRRGRPVRPRARPRRAPGLLVLAVQDRAAARGAGRGSSRARSPIRPPCPSPVPTRCGSPTSTSRTSSAWERSMTATRSPPRRSTPRPPASPTPWGACCTAPTSSPSRRSRPGSPSRTSRASSGGTAPTGSPPTTPAVSRWASSSSRRACASRMNVRSAGTRRPTSPGARTRARAARNSSTGRRSCSTCAAAATGSR